MSHIASLPKLSIIIPVYNVRNYVKKCLESVLKQSYAPLEIIIVNDATQDDSMSIVRNLVNQYKREVIILEHPENKGLGAARNTGIKVATGTYITFLDSDDWLDKDYLEQMIQVAVKHDVDVLLGCIKSYSDANKTYWEDRYFTPGNLQHKQWDNPYIIDNFQKFTEDNIPHIYDMFPAVAFGKLYKRHLFEFVLFPEGAIFEDEGFFKVLIWHIKSIGYFRAKKSWIYYRRNRKDSIISEFYAKGEKILDIITIADFIMEHTQKLSPNRIGFAQSIKINFMYNFIFRLRDIDRDSLNTMHNTGILADTLRRFIHTLSSEEIKQLPYVSNEIKDFLLIAQRDNTGVFELAKHIFFSSHPLIESEPNLHHVLYVFQKWKHYQIKKYSMERKPRLVRWWFIARLLYGGFLNYIRERRIKKRD